MPAAIATIVTDVFKHIDTNGDGVLSTAELKVVQKELHIGAAAFAADVAKIDANHDGAISKAELTAYLTAADTNHDGHISLAEAHALVPMIGSHVSVAHG